MKKGIFSGTIIFLALFLVSATIIQSRIPVQELKTTSDIEAIKNFSFTAQIAREFADKAFAETVYDEYYSDGCSLITNDDYKTRFKNYLSTANLGPCKITDPLNTNESPNVFLTTGFTKYFDTKIKILCQTPTDSSQKKISFQKNIDLNKAITGNSCLVVAVTDIQTALQEIPQP